MPRRAKMRAVLFPLLRTGLFRLDPETAHGLALRSLAVLGHAPRLGASPGRPVELLGLRFPNRLGVAAGFDKNAIAVDGWFALGFGHVEVGTVTPRPQAGNPQPRIFRLVGHEALINRMGFPNDGAEVVAARLRARPVSGGAARGIVGVNIGKNADTPLERAIDDYVACLRVVHDVADYVTVNVSSPNTKGLRSLQAREQLEPLLTAVRDESRRLAKTRRGRARPLLAKLAPDLDDEGLREFAQVVADVGFDGLIATNTTLSREAVRDAREASETGGLSGAPLTARSRRVVQTLRAAVGPALPIIGVGGIAAAADARAMRAAGADLIQLYTGLIYRGPGIVPEIAAALE
jgi:dihydroorotate dehydrogenase subfamily 2